MKRRRPQQLLVTALAVLATTPRPSSQAWIATPPQQVPLQTSRRLPMSLGAASNKKGSGRSFPVDDSNKSGKKPEQGLFTRGFLPPPGEQEDKKKSPQQRKQPDNTKTKDGGDDERGWFGVARGWFRRSEKPDEPEAKDPKKEKKLKQKEAKKAKETERERKRLEQEAKQQEKEKQQAAAKREKQRKKQIAKQKKKRDDNAAEKKKKEQQQQQAFFGRPPPKETPKDDESETSDSGPINAAQKFLSNAWSSGKRKEQWVPVISKTRLSPGEIVPATVGGIDLLVVASKDGRKLYCIANSCPHLGTPLETGQLVRLPIESSSTTSSSPSDNSGGAGGFKEAPVAAARIFTEVEVTKFLQQDGCEDCIVCPLHKTAFALESGQVRGEWCPYPPLVGKIVGTIKNPTPAAVFDIRTRGKNIEVRINTPLEAVSSSS